MVKDVHDALERVLGDPPPWRLDPDAVVAAGRQARRRRRAALAAGSSAAAVVAAGAVLATPAVVAHLRGTDPARVSVAAPLGQPTRSSASPRPASTATSAPDDGHRRERQAFARGGYTHADAVLLARLWGGGTTPDGATIRAGEALISGAGLPIRPGQTAQTVTDDVALNAFFDNGYDYDDATRLAALWHRAVAPGGDLSAVKAQAGRQLLAGKNLPLAR